MDLLGVGPLELIFILVIIFLVLGPNDLAATGKKIGRFLSTVRKSEFWRGVTQVSREMRDLPTTLMREAELEDAKKELEQEFKDVRAISQEFGQTDLVEIKDELEASIEEAENTIAPPELAGETEAEPEQHELITITTKLSVDRSVQRSLIHVRQEVDDPLHLASVHGIHQFLPLLRALGGRSRQA